MTKACRDRHAWMGERVWEFAKL